MVISKSRSQVFVYLLSAAVLVAANLFIFNTFDIFRENPLEFEVGYLDILGQIAPWVVLFIFLILLPSLFFPLSILRRYASLILMVGLLTWIQAGVLIWDYGVFDGRATNWEQYDLLGWADITLWLGLLITSVRFASRILPLANVIAWILIIGGAALLLSQGNLEKSAWTKKHQLSEEIPDEILEFSRNQNIVHIILDSMQTDVFLELAEKHDLFDEFSGFTLFYENVGVAPHTSLSIPAIFSGEIFDGSQSPSSYYKHAMTEGFQNKLHQAGFTVNLVPQLSMQDSHYSNYYKIPSTYQGTIDDLKNQNAAQLLDIALFRSSPHFLRKKLYDGGEWFLLPMVRGDMQVRSFQEKAFFKDYTSGIKLGGDTPAYHFIHLMPPHPPYVTLANGRYAGEILPNTRSNYLNESRAIIDLVVRYIKKLKSLEIYDESTIILQGDHGSQIEPHVDGEQIQTCVSRMPALLAVKPLNSNGSMKVSNAPTSLLDIAPTISKVLGDETQSVFDLDDSLSRQRPFILFDGKNAAAKIVHYSINGSVYQEDSCKRGDSQEVLAETGQFEPGTDIQFGMTGDADSLMGIGWSACQADYCWTIGGQADINLPIEKVAADLMLHVRFKPFVNQVKAPRQRIRVSVNGTQLAEWAVSLYAFQNAGVRIPEDLAQEENLQISFHFPDAVSPKALGLGGDGRLLGMALQTLRIDTLNKYRLGTEIEFGSAGNADVYTGIGWSACQPDYCWTIGNLADLTLPIEKVDTDLELQIRFKPFVNDLRSPLQRIGVSVNGTRLTEWSVSGYESQMRRVRIPAELTGDEALQISFHIPDAVSPRSLGLGGDVRLLGMAVQSLSVDIVNSK